MTLTYSSVSFWAVLGFPHKAFLQNTNSLYLGFSQLFIYLFFLCNAFIFTSPFTQSIAHHPSNISWHVTSSKRSYLTSTDIPFYQTRFISHATQTICFCNVLYLLFYNFFGGIIIYSMFVFFLVKLNYLWGMISMSISPSIVYLVHAPMQGT